MPDLATPPSTRNGPVTPRDDRQARTLPDQVMMPLLDRIVRESLDEDYQAARAGRGRRPPSSRPRKVAAVVMALFGVMVAIAAVQTARTESEDNASRASLVEQAQQRRARLAELQAELERLRTSTNDLRNDVSQATEDQQALAARVARLQARTGLGPVTGPGLRITVDDAPDGDVTQQVRDSDLAALVDGLYSAGAEAISVNGKRLTTLLAFDNVGPAIHIGGVPISAPYTVLAIGNPDTLEADLLESDLGQRWFGLVQSLGFEYDAARAESLSLPAAPPRRLRAVRLLGEEPERPAQDAEAGRS